MSHTTNYDRFHWSFFTTRDYAPFRVFQITRQNHRLSVISTDLWRNRTRENEIIWLVNTTPRTKNREAKVIVQTKWVNTRYIVRHLDFDFSFYTRPELKSYSLYIYMYTALSGFFFISMTRIVRIYRCCIPGLTTISSERLKIGYI